MVLGLMAIEGLLACQNAARPSRGKEMSITYEAKVRQTRWLAGSRVVLELRIENHGSGAFETPDPMYRTSAQPHFELTGPGGSRQEFRPDSRATEWDEGQPPAMVKLAPGQQWEGDMLLSSYAKLETPGRYTLRSWIENNGTRIEAAPSEFEIAAVATRDLAAETSLGENNTAAAECLELMEGGEVASSILRESDSRNAELIAFSRIERGATAPEATTILAPYSNFSVALSAVRWVVSVQNRKVTVGHNSTSKRITAFGGAEAGMVLAPVATKAGLYLAGIRGSELVLERISADEKTVEPGAVWTLEKFPAAPAAAAMTVSPEPAGSTLLFVLAWTAGDDTRVQFLTVSPGGKVLTRAVHSVSGVRPLGPAAAGWSTGGEVRASLLVRSAARATEVRVVELKASPALAVDGTPRLSEPVRLDYPLQDARLAYFEQNAGQLSRIAALRTTGGKTWILTGDGVPREPRTAIPGTGPLALLPGEIYWYAVWPEGGKLRIGAL
jgi:hypothetical protein